MAKIETIRVELTGAQMKSLFRMVDEMPGEGFILAQIGTGYMIVGFTTPYEVYKGMEKTIKKHKINRSQSRE